MGTRTCRRIVIQTICRPDTEGSNSGATVVLIAPEFRATPRNKIMALRDSWAG
jgi:hypothetical protein